VGKSALVNRFINNKFNEYYRATQFEKYTTSALVANRRVKYTIWDTAGSHAASSARQLAFREADVFLLCYRITDPSTLFSALNHWCPEIRSSASDPQVPIILVGCGADLRADRDLLSSLAKQGRAPISADQALSFSHQIGAAMYVETSAKNSARAAISAFEVAGLASMGKIVSGPVASNLALPPTPVAAAPPNVVNPAVTPKAYSKVQRGYVGLPPTPGHGYYPTGTNSSTGSGSHSSSNSPLDSLERCDKLSTVSSSGNTTYLGNPKHFRQGSSVSNTSGNADTSGNPAVGSEQFWEQFHQPQPNSPASRSISVPRNSNSCSRSMTSRSVTSSLTSSASSSKTKSSTSIPSITSSLGSKTPKALRKSSEQTSAASASEKTVTIKCQRLTADKTYEEIEVEVPAPIYETIQLYNDTGSLAARGTSKEAAGRRKSIGSKLKNLFVKN